MPTQQRIGEVCIGNHAYEQAVSDVQDYENSINALKKELEYVTKVLYDDRIQASLRAANSALIQAFNECNFDGEHQQMYGYEFVTMQRAIERSTDTKILRFTGVDTSLENDLVSMIDRHVERLNETKHRLASLNNTPRTVTIKEARSILNPLPYIKKGSVQFYTVDDLHHLRFTVTNTYITGTEPFRNAVGAPTYVTPIDASPHILLPSLVVDICLHTKEFSMQPSSTDRNKPRFSDSLVHPHYDGGPCWGNMADLFEEAVDGLDIKLIASVVRTWLQTANLQDTWGRRFYGVFPRIINRILRDTEQSMYNNYLLLPTYSGEMEICFGSDTPSRKVKLKEVSYGVYDLYLDEELIGRYDPH